ncbi:aryl hydrocarbon receptor-like isoform X3 [Cyclopterus lumpus]|uniref:aryl hydrocarbon receptor-like isoform X2 n=1 Tax=Cyclopterus lumpus TaxID=8103 RepID=UPI001485C46A|nr:aryl hydrocarbon receptor-like isoform X2 [Cyclopterus lumpus]XP_034403483.1 aryl hydrocarbon receptor-like isoform X3 [Cyclopterus lumpus]
MPGNSGLYAGKRRKKPVQKSAEPPAAKANPSKRHRDRLNGELERLTGLLPFSEEVRGRLDKLSVLRLSVGYLKAKSYFNASLQKHVRSAPLASANGRKEQSVSLDGVSFSEGELLLQALNGFVLVVTTDGTIFYTSPTIQDFLGFHQSDVLHQSVHDLIHTEDREMFRCQLHFALKPSDSHSDVRAQGGQSSSKAWSRSVSSLPQYVPPENSSFLDRSFCCRLRCLLDNTSGFLALNFNGRLKYLHLQGSTFPPQLALFAIATPLQPPSIMAIRTKTLIFQTKHRMDFAPLGIDTRGKQVLGYTEIELLTTGSGYQFIHAADMMYCADNHLRMIKTGDSGFTFFRLLTKVGRWLWVQANARIVFKGGRPDFIIARQKSLTNEEGEEHLHQRRQQLPFNLATGEGVLYDVALEPIPGLPGSGSPGTAEPATENPASLLGSLHRQDHSVYSQPQEPSAQLPIFTQIEDPDLERPQSTLEQAFLDSHAVLSVPSQTRGSRSITGDLTSESMIDSLQQILEDIVDGGLEGLDVEETELRDWESTLARLSDERDDVSSELNHILANDVFSYVEEALRRETAQGSLHVNKLSIQGQHPGTVFSNDAWRQTTNATSVFAEQAPFGDVEHAPNGDVEQAPFGDVEHAPNGDVEQAPFGDVEHAPNGDVEQAPFGDVEHAPNGDVEQAPFGDVEHAPNGDVEQAPFGDVEHAPNGDVEQAPFGDALGAAGYSVAHKRCRNAPRGHSSSPWPPGSSSSSSHRCGNQTASTQSCPAAGTQRSRPPSVQHTDGFHSSGRGSNQTVQYTLTGSQQLQSPSAWQQFHHHTSTHSSHATRSSGSCMYEKREGGEPDAGPLLGPSCSRGTANVLFVRPRASTTGGDLGPGMAQAMAAGCTDVDNVGFGSQFPPESGSIQSSFFCWTGDAQIPKVSLNGVIDPFAFSALPTGSINLPQNDGT